MTTKVLISMKKKEILINSNFDSQPQIPEIKMPWNLNLCKRAQWRENSPLHIAVPGSRG